MEPQRIEEVTFNAWPALQQLFYDGWLLRFGAGYTKRSNSVNVLYPGVLDLDEKIDHCAAWYAERELPPIFRLTSATAPAGLDHKLEQRGYEKISPTLVMALDLQQALARRAPSVTLQEEALSAWLSHFCALRGESLDQHVAHRQILEAIAVQKLWATLRDEAGQVVGCDMAMVDSGYVGLYNLITDPAQRGQGFGTALVAKLLDWAQDQGARYGYLQVEEQNEPARRVYETKLGYEIVYWYWYRRASGSA